ncbi:putative HAD superfamily hydrolase [Lineolata rhizophorae]|uniref:Putative HAD superfamily hydrolase n=1 Tax=Lineolata rhizophorae TaxID=578093 RepID=A0A6A6PCS2_9PEZI|nr:putative HAD superfamily hydrolase [Lineolata rhizophorae]
MSQQKRLPTIRACLFDMDGLLIDSEDLYTICTNELLREYGKPELPWNIKAQLQGRPGPEATRIFSSWAQLPLTTEEFMGKLAARQEKHFPRAQPLPGVPELLATLTAPSTSPPIRIALATSSHARNFSLKTTHLAHVFDNFRPEHRILGDDVRIKNGRGKPAPDIYLVALETINTRLREEKDHEPEIRPDECLVFEDSVPGVEAGRRAGMQVVWCPHPGLLAEFKGREKEVLAGLTGEHKEDAPGSDTPGEIDDGWGRLVENLVDFPYETYGIQTQASNT